MSGTKIILNQEVYNLGEEGDVCEVSRGYARNFLIPKKLAVPYSKETVAYFAGRREAIEKRKEEKRKQALGLRDRLEGTVLTVSMTAGESGRLFGSVTNTMVADELKKLGMDIEKKKIDVPSSAIKMVGEYTIHIKLYESEMAEVKLVVKDVKAKESSALNDAAQEAVKEVLAESEMDAPVESEEEEVLPQEDEESEEE
jgi:large subunit ribosomal protein L9